MTDGTTKKTEILCVCSGKGGVGKTLFASCLGFALTRAGLRVLMIDGDLATDGLSLFLLGPDGKDNMASFEPPNTLAGVINHYSATGKLKFGVRQVYRNGPHDHGVVYDTLISGRYLYGQESLTANPQANANLAQEGSQPPLNVIPSVDRRTFQSAVRQLFDVLRSQGEYDYVVVDTRGGFSFESTDLCALGDSFLVVVEADPTSFYQTSNLVQRIDEAAGEAGSKSVLRGFLINKAVDGLVESGALDLSKVEWSFRNALIRQFPILKYSDTYPIPADLQVLQSYKDQMVPLLSSPASLFTYATLTAYSNIFQVVTSRWTREQVQGWQTLVNSVAEAIKQRNDEAEKQRKKQDEEEAEVKRLRETSALSAQRIRDLETQIVQLRKDLDLAHAQVAAEFSRASAVEDLVRTVSSQNASPVPPSSLPAAPARPASAQQSTDKQVARAFPLFTIVALLVILALAGALVWVWHAGVQEKAAIQVQQAQQTSALQSQLATLTAQVQAATARSESDPAMPASRMNTAPVSAPVPLTGKTLHSTSKPSGTSPVSMKSAGGVTPISVTIHIDNSSQYDRAAQVQKALLASGMKAEITAHPYPAPLYDSEVDYYWLDPQSVADVQLIQKVLNGSGTTAALKLSSNSSKAPRTYGVWIASEPATPRSLAK